MRLKIISNGTLASTSIRDENDEIIRGVTGFQLTCNGENSLGLQVSFVRVPFEISMDLRKSGGGPIGTVSYLCGCIRNYFSDKDAPEDGELCPFHGDAVRFSRANNGSRPLVKIEGTA